MKRVIKFFAIIALFFATNTTMGAEPKVTVNEARKNIVIELDKPTLEYRVRFVDMEDHIIYSQRIHKSEIRDKKLDLTKLPIGNYVLTIENYFRSTEFMITVERAGASMVSKKIDYKPIFRKKDGRVYLNLLNLDLNPVDIEVRDAMDRLLFSETMDGTLTVVKSFNFKKALEGIYIIKVKDGATVYTEEINVR